MRLIDGEKLIEWLKYWDKSITKDINAPDVGEANSIIKDVLQTVVDQLTDMDALEWIPVSEGLPNDHDTVLVTKIIYGGEKDIDLAFYGHNAFTGFKEENGEKLTVTAWMRLPEPWEGEE